MFLNISAKLLPWLWGLTASAFALGLFGAFTAPPDYQQGGMARIHHTSCSGSLGGDAGLYADGDLGNRLVLVWRHPLANAAQKAAGPLGAAFTLICLITGSLWGKPMWGTYWVWDARLTSMLILFLIYLGLIGFRRQIEDTSRAARAAHRRS